MTEPAGDAAWVNSLTEELGGSDWRNEAQAFARRCPSGYRVHTSPSEAARDLQLMGSLVTSSGPSAGGSSRADPTGGGASRRFESSDRFLALKAIGDVSGTFRLRRYSLMREELSSFFPLMESFGLAVTEVFPYRFAPGAQGEPEAHLEDFVLRLTISRGGRPDFDPMADGPRLVDALEAIGHGEFDVASLNRLVTCSDLNWRQVVVLRTYGRFLHQIGGSLSDEDMEEALVAYPTISQSLVEYFEARFDPEPPGGGVPAATARERVIDGLSGVPGLEQDGAFRRYLAMMDATVRTNFFRRDSDGKPSPNLALKVSREPEPSAARFWVETFVFGPLVEGIHLRAGPVARGGIRWSTRARDFRTEIFDLALAQVRKNALIVPTGAKGGFVCRNWVGAAPTTLEIEESYRGFINALLDITDNVIGERAVVPDGVVTFDGEDPYLVVAADSGTGRFSDTANAISIQHGFWLNDAFASGGSHGFDHKAMGITSRGAWRSVQNHFRQLGVDVQSESVRVIGIGDMSGDVFGNGMLLSKSILLLAAFDHRHIFLDPHPDPIVSFAERARLKALPVSSWSDYNRTLLSAGGGVWSRSTKKIPISAEVGQALGIREGELSPPELISALLEAPVDLLWMAGIGTYVKGPEEMDAAVGDHENDLVRITSDQIRARVVVEGANLGITQRARISYSRRGGRINTDFIDNAAGVATSDREVNLKILLSLAIEDGSLHLDQRDQVLAESQGEVADEVLRQIDHSVAALNHALAASAAQFDAYVSQLEALDEADWLDRKRESLPDAEEMAHRRTNGAGLLRPELAVLLASTKSALADRILASPAVTGPAAMEIARSYFPAPLRAKFGHLVPLHRVFNELVATILSNELVDHLGIVWTHETAEELGRDVEDVAAAFWAARVIIGAGELWAEIETLSPRISADTDAELHRTVADAVAALARSYLRETGPVVSHDLIARDRPLADEVLSSASSMTSWLDKKAGDTLSRLGVDADVTTRFVAHASLVHVGEVGMVMRSTRCSLSDALGTLIEVERIAGTDRLAETITGVAVADRWRGWQVRALCDEVEDWRRQTAQDILRGDGQTSLPESLGRWKSACTEVIDRARELIAEFDVPASDKLTVAALVLRTLRSIP